MPTYQTFIRDDGTGDIWQVLPTSVTFKDTLNKESTASFKFSFKSLEDVAEIYNNNVVDLFTSELREIYVTRDTVKIFYGVITEVTAKPGQDGKIDFSVKAVSFFGMFAKRIVGVPVTTYTATDAGAIAWDLIDDSQTADSPYSDWGITQGSITTSVNRDRTYKFDNIRDEIVRLSNDNLSNGFDFDINNDKEFNVYYPTKGSDRTSLILSDKNTAGWDWTMPLLLDLTNKVHVLGEDQGDAPLYETRTAGTTYRTPFGTLESVLREESVKVAATLQNKGDRYLTDNREPLPEFKVSHYDSTEGVELDEYDIGDTIYVLFPRIGFSTATGKRVKQREFKLNADTGSAIVTAILEL